MNTEEYRRTAGVRRFFNSLDKSLANSGTYRFQNPHTSRYVTVNKKKLSAFAGFLPHDVITQFESAQQRVEQLEQKSRSGGSPERQGELAEAEMVLEKSKKAVINALLAARQNYATWKRVDPAVTRSRNLNPGEKRPLPWSLRPLITAMATIFPKKARPPGSTPMAGFPLIPIK